jgi:hypothetical protein
MLEVEMKDLRVIESLLVKNKIGSPNPAFILIRNKTTNHKPPTTNQKP